MSKFTETPLAPAPPPQSPIAVHKPWYRRPILILPLVLIVMAAVGITLFFALSPRGITARGTVIDRLTGQPVAAASLHGGGKSTTTNAHGKFQIAGIAADTALRVQARYYAPTQVKATQTPVTVRLAPIPVAVTITSALTGSPLRAGLVMPNGDRVLARPDGTATLYRIGPGETVTMKAAGYVPAHALVGSDDTVKAALEPTLPTMRAQLRAWDRSRHYQSIIDWVLRPATGYTFMGTGAHAWVRENKEIAGDPQTAYIGGGFTGNGTGVTIQISWPGERWDTAGLASLLTDGPVHRVTLAGQQAWQLGPGNDHVFSTMWSSGPVLVITAGTAHANVDAVMTGIIKAMTGQGS